MNQKRQKTLLFGSIASGSMRPEHIYPWLEGALLGLRLSRKDRATIRRWTVEFDRALVADEVEVLDDVLNDLFDLAQGYAPAYAYVGAHPGDGTDFGVWLSEDFEVDFVDGGGLKVNDTSEVPTGYSGEVLHVNDHGNCTLYSCDRGRMREIWSVV